MRYMFLIYSDEDCWTDENRQECMIESMEICDELASQGALIAASPLEPVNSAISVRVRNEQTQITTGPFAETTEQLGGFYLLELDDLDKAIGVACRLPPAKKGTVEIRPVQTIEGLPTEQFALLQEQKIGLKPFLLLAYDDETYWVTVGPEVYQIAINAAVGITRQLASSNQFISAAPLHPTTTATSVRVRNGQRLISDGPFAETREVLGGYYLILVPDQNAAATVAAMHPGAKVGTVEVRPVFDLSQVSKF